MSANPQECQTFQVIEPDGDSPVESIGGAISDPALTERGEVVLVQGQSEVSVTFLAQKVNSSYKFEYLYVDDLGGVTPGTIQAIPTAQTIFGFTAELAGVPDDDGPYTLRWRVVVVDLSSSTGAILDAPERQYLQIPWQVPDLPIPPGSGSGLMTVTWANPRSSTTYGFTELRAENLVDDPSIQTPILMQIVSKTKTDCTIAYTPLPITPNYYLTIRTP